MDFIRRIQTRASVVLLLTMKNWLRRAGTSSPADRTLK
jgi:hypothetical protein